MDIEKNYSDLKSQFPNLEIYQNYPLAPYTTVKIGGPADIFVHTKSSEELKNILSFCRDARSRVSTNIPITILGNGSNVLISDSGIRGIVIKNDSTTFSISDTIDPPEKINRFSTQRTENDPNKYLNFGTLDYDESDKPRVSVKIDSGCNLPQIINQLIDKNITGLQWFGYIPGSIGGAIFCNIHGGAYNFSDFIKEIEVFDLKSNELKNYSAKDLEWGYDFSSFQQNPHLIILSVTLSLFKGDIIKAKETVAAWIKQKSTVQSMNSLGSVFKNPPLEVCQPIWGEQKSAGWIIDNELKLKGQSNGDAQVSLKHANIIINNGHAMAKNYLDLIELVQSQIQTKFGFQFELEIKLIGF
jgi:UDP-N-acetylmuramate dehydrogenase